MRITAINIFGLRSGTHAIKLLVSDHRELDALFKEFDDTEHKSKQAALITKIAQALVVHAEIEERLFYPETRRVLGEKENDQVDEAVVEHATLKGLILRLDGMSPGDAMFKAYATVLKEYNKHHVKEEESEYFPRVEKTNLDLEAMGLRMKTLKDQLMKQAQVTAPTGTVAAKLLPTPPISKRARTVKKKTV